MYGLTYIWQAIDRDEIYIIVRGAMEESARAHLEVDEYKREIDKLKREINLLRQKESEKEEK